ncbi:hypothetical protein BDQ17DRAFT_1436452 [Cyathus striatus]|nr:hypothetical protein BDQ17DRAFT_1436452 [Cyathus striatus]
MADEEPNLLLVSILGYSVVLTDQGGYDVLPTHACGLTFSAVLLVPLAYTIGKTYGISNEALLGACFIPAGIGNMIGASLAGRFSDRIIVRYREQRKGICIQKIG